MKTLPIEAFNPPNDRVAWLTYQHSQKDLYVVTRWDPFREQYYVVISKLSQKPAWIAYLLIGDDWEYAEGVHKYLSEKSEETDDESVLRSVANLIKNLQ